MELLLGALILGLAYAPLGLGVFITMRVFNFPDITADGSLTFGAAITAALLIAGVNPWLAIAASVAGGFMAGSLTGVIHTRLRVNGLLSGILVMTALYSVNLRTMGRSNVPLLATTTALTQLERLPGALGMSQPDSALLPLLLFGTVALLLVWGLAWFFRTDFGLAMRATGDNETMITAQGVNTNAMKIVGIGLSNALIALSGSLVAQYQGYADIGMGVGIVVFGLASVIIGDTLAGIFGGGFNVWTRLICVIAGTILFRVIVAAALSVGLAPADLKIVTAGFVLAAILLPRTRGMLRTRAT
ncbi:MAG TPA: ABC transporter permease [Candidatus Kapabacteria bacterium]|nr:ABC transporter permease [Candidatus Kapabacteria bacterium]